MGEDEIVCSVVEEGFCIVVLSSVDRRSVRVFIESCSWSVFCHWCGRRVSVLFCRPGRIFRRLWSGESSRKVVLVGYVFLLMQCDHAFGMGVNMSEEIREEIREVFLCGI